MDAAQLRPARIEGMRAVPVKTSKTSKELRNAMVRAPEESQRAIMCESGRRDLREDVRMGLKLETLREVEERKSELGGENPAAVDASSSGDSIGISLLD